MQAEVVAVPTRGVERWLTQRLSAVLGASPGRADGVCANVEFPFPGPARQRGRRHGRRRRPGGRSVAAGAVGLAAARRGRGVARRALAGAAGGAPRRAEADADASRRARRLSSVRHIADLYDRYAVHRPGDAARVGGGERRRLAGRVVEAAARTHRRAEPGRAAGRRLRAAAGRAGSGRPAGARVAVRPDAPAGELPRRPARAGGRAGRAPLPPSPLGRAVGADRRRSPATVPPIVRRDEDATAALPQNPLLASWGQDAREMQLVLAGGPDDVGRPRPPRRRGARGRRCSAESRPTFAPTAPRRACLSRAPATSARCWTPDDRSLQVHACHGRARQVEVVRDAILHLLADDPTLEPRDIVVMCPDIEVFAPLIHATFGTGAGARRRGRGAAGRRDADRPARAPRRPLAAPDEPGARRRRAAARPRRRPADRLAGARPGGARAGPPALPPRRRRPRADRAVGARRAACAGASMRRSAPRTGSSGCRRTRGRRAGIGCWWAWRWRRRDSGCSADVLPLDDVGSGDIDLAGRFAEFLERLHAVVDAFADPMPLDAWAAAIAEAADSLTAAPGRGGVAARPARPRCSRTSSPRARPPAR